MDHAADTADLLASKTREKVDLDAADDSTSDPQIVVVAKESGCEPLKASSVETRLGAINRILSALLLLLLGPINFNNLVGSVCFFGFFVVLPFFQLVASMFIALGLLISYVFPNENRQKSLVLVLYELIRNDFEYRQTILCFTETDLLSRYKSVLRMPDILTEKREPCTTAKEMKMRCVEIFFCLPVWRMIRAPVAKLVLAVMLTFAFSMLILVVERIVLGVYVLSNNLNEWQVPKCGFVADPSLMWGLLIYFAMIFFRLEFNCVSVIVDRYMLCEVTKREE